MYDKNGINLKFSPSIPLSYTEMTSLNKLSNGLQGNICMCLSVYRDAHAGIAL